MNFDNAHARVIAMGIIEGTSISDPHDAVNVTRGRHDDRRRKGAHRCGGETGTLPNTAVTWVDDHSRKLVSWIGFKEQKTDASGIPSHQCGVSPEREPNKVGHQMQTYRGLPGRVDFADTMEPELAEFVSLRMFRQSQ